MKLDFQPQRVHTHEYDRFEVEAEGLGRYTIEVSLPSNFSVSSGARLPVILVTDGNFMFDLTQTLVHGNLANMSAPLPPSIVVGVGYPEDEGKASYYARRNFDFFGDWDMTDAVGQLLLGILESMKNAEDKRDLVMRAGGCSRFIRFLQDELLPALARHYPIDTEARHTLMGDSSGGHFVLRALFEPNTCFKRYISVSPAFGCASGTIAQAEAAYASEHNDLDADLFICCGRHEVGDNRTYGLAHAGSGVTWVAEQLAIREWPSARVHWEIMSHEDHASILPRALAAGLRSVHRVRPGVHTEEHKKATNHLLQDLASGRRGI